MYGLQLAGKATEQVNTSSSDLLGPFSRRFLRKSALSRCRVLREGRRLQKEEPVALERLVAVDRLLGVFWETACQCRAGARRQCVVGVCGGQDVNQRSIDGSHLRIRAAPRCFSAPLHLPSLHTISQATLRCTWRLQQVVVWFHTGLLCNHDTVRSLPPRYYCSCFLSRQRRDGGFAARGVLECRVPRKVPLEQLRLTCQSRADVSLSTVGSQVPFQP